MRRGECAMCMETDVGEVTHDVVAESDIIGDRTHAATGFHVHPCMIETIDQGIVAADRETVERDTIRVQRYQWRCVPWIIRIEDRRRNDEGFRNPAAISVHT